MGVGYLGNLGLEKVDSIISRVNIEVGATYLQLVKSFSIFVFLPFCNSVETRFSRFSIYLEEQAKITTQRKRERNKKISRTRRWFTESRMSWNINAAVNIHAVHTRGS